MHDMDDRADYDDVAWDQNDAACSELQKPYLLRSTLQTLESIVRTHCGEEARWVRPLHIGGYNLIYVMDLATSNLQVVIRLPRPHLAQFAHEKTLQEAATMNFLAKHTLVPVPEVFAHGKHGKLGPYIILSFIENNGSLLRVLAEPKDDVDEAPVLNLEIADAELENHYFGAAVCLLQLFQPCFSRIGSLAESSKDCFVIQGRPITQNMNNMVQLANIPKSVLPAEDKTYETANEWYRALAEMHMLQLAFQHNDLVKDANDCRNKYIARRLFLKLARAGRLSTFGFVEDKWSAQSKGGMPTYCKAPGDRGPFRLWCDDFRPANTLLPQNCNWDATIIDWEFTYIAPAQFSLDPPWWLLLDVPEMWHLGIDDWSQKYDRCLEIWLRAVRKAEQDSTVKVEGFLLSDYMQESWNTGRFWLNYAARKSWAFDTIFWRHLDERFFGKRRYEADYEQLWEARIGLLSRSEKHAMDAFVEKKMKESQVRKLVSWTPEEAKSRMHEVLYQERRGPIYQCVIEFFKAAKKFFGTSQ